MKHIRKLLFTVFVFALSLVFSIVSSAEQFNVLEDGTASVDCSHVQNFDDAVERGIIFCTHHGKVELKVGSLYNIPKVTAFISHTKDFSIVPCDALMRWELEWSVYDPNNNLIAHGVRDDGGAGLAAGGIVRESFSSGQIAFGCYFSVNLITTVDGETSETGWGGVYLERPED